MFIEKENAIYYASQGVWVSIEPWGANSLRVRSSRNNFVPTEDWALLPPEKTTAEIERTENYLSIRNGKIRGVINRFGKITFYNDRGKILLKEYWRDQRVVEPKEYDSALEVHGRELLPILDGDYSLNVRFEPNLKEKIYGMGQYQQEIMDLKGCDLELAHRNSQSSVPFYISSEGYGFLWNNPAIGRVVFGKNLTTWHARSTKAMDYWITAGDSTREIERQYATATGKTPMMPDYAMGFWQCKLRYRTQQELLEVAREYKRRRLPLSVIVIDFFHWPHLGDFKFDDKYWPDPDAMTAELKEMGVEPAVSIWPFIEDQSENYEEMRERGYLIQCEKGLDFVMANRGSSTLFDATNPDAQNYVWKKAKENYYKKGIKIFWLDEAEPEYTVYDFENYRYYLGPNSQIGNTYPVGYAKGFYDGRKAEGEEKILNLIRCAWAGSQRYGTLVWSGDIHSSFESFRQQICAGLNMGISGIPWWTTDIGGFSGGNAEDPEFRELLVRWFQYGTFCPVMRLHGDRKPRIKGEGLSGSGCCGTGSPNEVWSFGEEVYQLLKPYLFIREALRPYISNLMEAAHESGDPVIRPLFYEFPEDPVCWEIQDSYLFGDQLLVAPIVHYMERQRMVYLPKGKTWTDVWSQKKYDGGQWIDASAPISQIPLYAAEGFDSQPIRKAAFENGMKEN